MILFSFFKMKTLILCFFIKRGKGAETHGYGAVAASAYPVEEVSGSRPGRVILKT